MRASPDDFEIAIVGEATLLRSTAYGITKNADSAKDLVQETILKALVYRSTFKEGTNLRGWLVTIMRNTFFNQIRKRATKNEIAVDDLSLYDPGLGPTQEHSILLAQIWAELEKLADDQKLSLFLVAIEGYSYAEAAEVLGTNEGTVKSRVSRAREHLASYL